MRLVLLMSAGVVGWGVSSVAWAQDLQVIQARNQAAQALEDARRDLLAGQIDASNAQERARTQVILRDLEARRSGEPLGLRPLSPLAGQAPGDLGRRDADLATSLDRLERLTQEALAQSNARMRAIRPASEPKE